MLHQPPQVLVVPLTACRHEGSHQCLGRPQWRPPSSLPFSSCPGSGRKACLTLGTPRPGSCRLDHCWYVIHGSPQKGGAWCVKRPSGNRCAVDYTAAYAGTCGVGGVELESESVGRAQDRVRRHAGRTPRMPLLPEARRGSAPCRAHVRVCDSKREKLPLRSSIGHA